MSFAFVQRLFAAAATGSRENRRTAGAGAEFVDNRPQKAAVNPLTRLANRSVMRRIYPVAAR
jgi:hypothetical protein